MFRCRTRSPGLGGYAISHITDTLTHPHAPLIQMPREIDGIAETWADSTEAQARMAASSEAQTWFADGAKFIGHVKSFRTEETTSHQARSWSGTDREGNLVHRAQG